jgi:hypothetical protein
MALSSPTKAAFVKSLLIEMGSVRRLNKMSGSARLAYVLARIQRVVEYEVVTHHQAMIAYAVAWSIQSSRLNQEPEQAMRAMDTRALVGLVYDLGKSCSTMIEVTERLNTQFTPKPVVAQVVEQEQSESLTPAQERVMNSLKSGDTLCTVEQSGKVVESRLYNQQIGETPVSKQVASALLVKGLVHRSCWYESTDGQHVEYVAA